MASSHSTLKRQYNIFNRKYFNNELPTDIHIIWSPLDRAHGASWPQEKTIHLDPPLAAHDRYRKIVILHEMVHIKHPRAGHGKVFQAEIDRLYAAGAFHGLI